MSPRPRIDRIAAVALLAALPLLARCTSLRPWRAPEPQPATAQGSPAAAPRLELAPDPDLQRLIDPRPAADGPDWLGGDVATSVAVSRDRWIWLFGDTLLGTAGEGCRSGVRAAPCTRAVLSPDAEASLIRNSVGVMWRWGDGRLSPVVKSWRLVSGQPAPIFACDAPEEFLWPLAAARVGSVLLVAASRHTAASGLRPVGNVYLRVVNPDAPPDLWSYTRHPVPNVRAGPDETLPLTWTTALVADGAYLYAFGERDVGLRARTVLSRLPVAGLDEPDWKPLPEYLAAPEPGSAPVWTRYFALEALAEVAGLPGTSEATVDRSPTLGWTTFQIPPLDFDIHLYTAPDLAGPWSDRGVVYRIPPPWSLLARTDCFTPELACGQDRFAAYAVKSHPELAPPGGFALSYNVNLLFGTLAAAEREAESIEGFYVPQMVAGVPLP